MRTHIKIQSASHMYSTCANIWHSDTVQDWVRVQTAVQRHHGFSFKNNIKATHEWTPNCHDFLFINKCFNKHGAAHWCFLLPCRRWDAKTLRETRRETPACPLQATEKWRDTKKTTLYYYQVCHSQTNKTAPYYFTGNKEISTSLWKLKS